MTVSLLRICLPPPLCHASSCCSLPSPPPFMFVSRFGLQPSESRVCFNMVTHPPAFPSLFKETHWWTFLELKLHRTTYILSIQMVPIRNGHFALHVCFVWISQCGTTGATLLHPPPTWPAGPLTGLHTPARFFFSGGTPTGVGAHSVWPWLLRQLTTPIRRQSPRTANEWPSQPGVGEGEWSYGTTSLYTGWSTHL